MHECVCVYAWKALVWSFGFVRACFVAARIQILVSASWFQGCFERTCRRTRTQWTWAKRVCVELAISASTPYSICLCWCTIISPWNHLSVTSVIFSIRPSVTPHRSMEFPSLQGFLSRIIFSKLQVLKGFLFHDLKASAQLYSKLTDQPYKVSHGHRWSSM